MSPEHTTESVRATILPGLDFDKPHDAEAWRPVAGWPGYEVSDAGRVYSYRVNGGRGRGRGRQARFRLIPKLLKPYVAKSGHMRVTLCRNQGKEQRRALIHVLVLEAFTCPRPAGKFACHNDGNPGNNRLDNLRWDTPSANSLDMVRQGRQGASSLSGTDIPPIWARLVAGDPCKAVGRAFGVSAAIVSSIKRGVTWSHVTRHLPGWPLAVRPLVPTARDPGSLQPVYPAAEFLEAEEELWRPVPGLPGYRASTLGRIMTCFHRRGMTDRWRFKPFTASRSTGYHRFEDRQSFGRKTELMVHGLVLAAFAGPRPLGMVACHADGDRRNNHVRNLRWDTQRANMLERFRHAEERLAVAT